MRDNAAQLVVVDDTVADESGDVDGSEIAGFVRQQRLFSARVGSLDWPKLRRRIRGVDAVVK